MMKNIGEYSLARSVRQFVKTSIMTAAIGLGLTTFAAADFSGLKPASPQPSADSLKPGLAVTYYGVKLNSIRQFLEWMEYEKGKPGKPIPMLNYQVGKGNVLTTTTTDLVGADIKGLINFEKKGTYTIMVHSNDGVRVTIGGVMVHEDPEVHADRFSDEIKRRLPSIRTRSPERGLACRVINWLAGTWP